MDYIYCIIAVIVSAFLMDVPPIRDHLWITLFFLKHYYRKKRFYFKYSTPKTAKLVGLVILLFLGGVIYQIKEFNLVSGIIVFIFLLSFGSLGIFLVFGHRAVIVDFEKNIIINKNFILWISKETMCLEDSVFRVRRVRDDEKYSSGDGGTNPILYSLELIEKGSNGDKGITLYDFSSRKNVMKVVAFIQERQKIELQFESPEEEIRFTQS